MGDKLTEINKLFSELLDIRENRADEDFSEDERRLIHEISEKCKGMNEKSHRHLSEKYKIGMSAMDVFCDMVGKVVIAPTLIHAQCAICWLIPVLDEKLMEEANA